MTLMEAEDAELNAFLARVEGGRSANTETLDGFFATLACCPDTIMPNEYMPLLQGGATEEGDLVFEGVAEAERFMALISRHCNHVNDQLLNQEAYLPLVLVDENGDWYGNDWAAGFLLGTRMRTEIWSEIIYSEERGGTIIPTFALAHETIPTPRYGPTASRSTRRSASGS